MKKLIYLFSVIIFMYSWIQCKKKEVKKNSESKETATPSANDDGIYSLQENKINTEVETATDAAKEWLENLFKCRNGNKFCFYLETEERATTKRFYEFMIDSEQIYGATNMSEEEMPLAKKKYKEKWSKIYPLRKDMEPWLFGRGQDDMENIKNVKIEKISDLKYRVFADYGDEYQTLNEVTLVKDKNSYLIDYCATEFLN